MVHNTTERLQLLRGLDGVFDGLIEEQVDNVVAVVGDSNLISVRLGAGSSTAHPQLGSAALQGWQVSHQAHGVLMAEGSDLHRQREARTQPLTELGFVHNDNELVRHHLYHLLAQQGAAASLHQVQVGVHFISAIDGHVELGVGVQGYQRNAQRLGLLLCPDGGWDRHDVLKVAGGQLLTKALDRKVSCRARSQTYDHAACHIVINGLVADHLLQLILAEGKHACAGAAVCHTGGEPPRQLPWKTGHRGADAQRGSGALETASSGRHHCDRGHRNSERDGETEGRWCRVPDLISDVLPM
mmetsp:Transcript_15727/g.44008  ORF Transcript_15727/g.44008 Transcript_15727/m.44008 type:complete len:299 (+) Transcript_15727:147-1043(+)